MANPDSQRRCVFVGNIPYDATEEQLVQICEEVGPVVSFRLVTDRETGKPKGYGFCEYKDEETALSARRNLQGYEINGRQLRVDFAENDKNADKNREQGRGGPGMVAGADPQRHIGGPAALGNSSLHQPIGHAVATTAATVMAGALGAAQMGSSLTQTGLHNQFGSGIDPLSLYLSKMSRSQLYEIISDMKAIATQNKEQARQILHTVPNLSKAIFQAQLMLGLVTPQMLQMPNIRQSSVPPPHSILPDSHRNQQLAVRTLPGIPPPHSSLAQTRPQVQLPQSAENNILQHGRLPIHSGVQAIPSIRPQGNLTATLPIQVGTSTSSSLKQQMHHPLLPQAGLVPSANLAYTSQPAAPNAALQPSLACPPATEKVFQQGSSAVSTPLDNIIKGTQIVANNSAWLNKTIPPSGLPERARVPNDSIDAMNRPSKLSKLNDGRSSYSPAELNVGTLVTRPSRSASLSGNQISGSEEASSSEKPALQITPDVESALLQQVLSLTPEQLNSLPPDQRQQVLQLQRMLRQPT
ncbi:cleavage stimulating factor 64 isoform X1 [Ipomoea triloba]|uniref:cleavage stimulating factor 64 isoform X1 n=1 Tax=Ipomoea triloba TaxID=35885 RepID=UPI00125E836F|nr:cleavage stimulating factor 64 isoform X1 [Ipomoea triloba]